MTVALGLALVYGILRAAEPPGVRQSKIRGLVSIRLATVPMVAGVMALGLMTLWGRVDWATPWVALGQVAVTAVGASLGDVLPRRYE